MYIINSISEFHEHLSLPAPLHPLVSVSDVSNIHPKETKIWQQFYGNFYCISLKKDVKATVKYGQQYYDFNKGTMNFIAPKQIQSLSISEIQKMKIECGKGYMLLFHPDFLAKSPLSVKVKSCSFFSYSVNEALHLSEKEEQDIIEIFRKIETEYQHIDTHTQDIILSQIDLILNYSNRFYERQFITRKAVNNDLLFQMEQLLNDYFENDIALKNGLPTVEYVANKLNLSANYLSDMLRSLTGQNTQQHIHEKLIGKAKEKLSTTHLSVSEIAYELGFEQPQSFNRLFKKKTDQSPLEFRESFN
jgi:AraC family transcriptional regulator, transcriptional activator of pobA